MTTSMPISASFLYRWEWSIWPRPALQVGKTRERQCTGQPHATMLLRAAGLPVAPPSGAAAALAPLEKRNGRFAACHIAAAAHLPGAAPTLAAATLNTFPFTGSFEVPSLRAVINQLVGILGTSTTHNLPEQPYPTTPPPPEHDGLDPLPPLPVRQPLAVGAGVPRHQGLAKLVAIVGGAVRGVNQDLPGRGQAGRVLKRLVFPRQLIPA